MSSKAKSITADRRTILRLRRQLQRAETHIANAQKRLADSKGALKQAYADLLAMTEDRNARRERWPT